MNNLYKEAMDEINISDQCLRKVKSMNNNNKKIKKFRLKYAVVFATLVLSFFAFNIVSYKKNWERLQCLLLRSFKCL